MGNTKKFTFPLCIVIVLLLFSCSTISGKAYLQADREFKKSIIGTWKISDKSLEGRITYFKDGRAEASAIYKRSNQPVNVFVKGAWEIKKNKLIMRVRKSSHPGIIPLGTATMDDIVSITDDKLLLISEDNVRLERLRVLSSANKKTHRKLAEKFFNVTKAEKVSRLWFNRTRKLLTTLPEGKILSAAERKRLQKVMHEMNWEDLKSLYIDSIQSVYSAEEIRDLIKFYQTPYGKKVIDKIFLLTDKSDSIRWELMLNQISKRKRFKQKGK